MRKNNSRGFTLVELMIVVSIIGILAAVSILQFNRFRVKAFNSTAKIDLKNAKTELEAYHVEHNNYPTE